jgi:hypothetical protein
LRELGFDGVVFNEHHYSAYGTMPSPNLIAPRSAKTKRIKIRCSETSCAAQSSRSRRREYAHDRLSL